MDALDEHMRRVRKAAEDRLENESLCVQPRRRTDCTCCYNPWPTTMEHLRNLWRHAHCNLAAGADKVDDKDLILWDKPAPQNFYEPLWIPTADPDAPMVECTGHIRTAQMLISAAGDADQCMLIWLRATLVFMARSLEVHWPDWVKGHRELVDLMQKECDFEYAHAVKRPLLVEPPCPPCPSFSDTLEMAVVSRLLTHGFYKIVPTSSSLEKRKYYWEQYRKDKSK